MARASIRLQAYGERQVAGEFNKVNRNLNRTEATSRRVTAGMRRGWGQVGGSVRGLYAAIGGAGLAVGAKRVMDYRQALGQLQADANLTNAQAEKMATTILGLSTRFNVSKDSITGAVQVFQDFGGIVPKGMTILQGLTKVSKASGTEMRDLATIASTLIQTLGMKPDEALEMVTLLNDQALKGQVALRDLAKVIPGVMGAGVGKGFAGKRAVQQLGSLMQVAGQAVGGNADVARTQALALIRDLTKAAPTLKKKFKIDVFDKDRNMRDINVIMAQVVKATKGKLGIAGKKGGFKEFFTEESAKVAGVFKSMFDFDRAAGLPPAFKKGSTIENVLGAKGGMQSVEAQLQRRVGGIAKEAEEFEGALKQLDEATQKYGAQILKWASQNKAQAAGAGLGAMAAIKLGPQVIKWAMGRGLGGGKLGSGKGAAAGLPGLPGTTAPVPVYIVSGKGGGVGAIGSEATKSAGKLSKVGAAASSAGAALGALLVGYQVGSMLDQWLGLSDKVANLAHKIMPETASSKVATSAAQQAAWIRQRERESGAKGVTVMRQAQQFANLAAKGVKSVGGPGGQRTALTPEGIATLIAKSVKSQGLSESQFTAMIATMNKNLQGIKIIAKPGDGLDKIKVQLDRGPKQ